MAEIISVNIGGAGVKINESLLDLFCLEHSIQSDGKLLSEKNSENQLTSFFIQNKDKYSPRSVFIDLDPTPTNQLLTSKYPNLLHPDTLISGKEDASSNYARGYYSLGSRIIDDCLDSIRKLADTCSTLQGFIITNSTGGGTGSGLGSLIMERLTVDYQKKSKFGFTLLPSSKISRAFVEPYNSILGIRSVLDYLDSCAVFDNEAIYDICQERLLVERPKYRNMNQLISQVISSLTVSMRYDGSLNINLRELNSNHVTYPRLKFLLPSFGPLISSEFIGKKLFLNDSVCELFEPASMMVKCDPRYGKYMACSMMYRGTVVPRDVGFSIGKVKTRRSINFVDWCPTGFKCGINYMPPIVFPGGDLKKTDFTVCMISNSSSVSQAFSRLGYKFDLMYSKRAFLHWFLREGMEEAELSEAREDLAFLEKDYEEVGYNSLYWNSEEED